MRTCRYIKDNTKSPGLLSSPLIKNKLYYYMIIDFDLEDDFGKKINWKHDHVIYETTDDSSLIDIFNKQEFENSFKDIQKERKLKLEKLNENR